MPHIQEVAQQLAHIYSKDGPAIAAWSSLKEAEEAMAGARDTLSEVGEGSQQSELSDSTAAYQKAIEAASGARLLVSKAAGRIATVRSRVLGEDYDGRSRASASVPTRTFRSGEHASLAGGKRPEDAILTHFHRDAQGHVRKGHPDPSFKAEVAEYRQGMVDEAIRFQTFVDAAPNLNETYSDEITTTQQYFESRGMPISPIVVLGREEFATACQLSDEPKNPDATGGFVLHDRIIIKEQTGKMASYGVMQGVAIHEAAHSTTGYDPKTIMETADGQNGKLTAIVGSPRGFRKYQSKAHDTGGYFEEGFCDLTRVDALTELGKESRLDGRMAAEAGCTYVREGHETPLPSLTSEEFIIPARFATGAQSPDSEGKGGGLISGPACVAAYGLHLMDKEAPGLREAMRASRSDPKQQARVIQLVESIKPGLYRELRQLPASFEGSKQGLRIIGQAIRDKG